MRKPYNRLRPDGCSRKRLTIKKSSPKTKFSREIFKVVKIGIANKSIRCQILAPYKIARLIIS